MTDNHAAGHDDLPPHEHLTYEEHKLADAERVSAGGERLEAGGERSSAVDERGLAGDERGLAVDERDAAETERCEARDERVLAADERRASSADRISRNDVTALGRNVTDLAESVRELHDLIHHSLVKSEQAITLAEHAPSKRRVYTIAGAITLLALLLAAGGIVTTRAIQTNGRNSRDAQYENCLIRNDAQRTTTEAAKANADYLRKINDAVASAQSKGSVLALELAKRHLFDPPPAAPAPTPLVDCNTLR